MKDILQFIVEFASLHKIYLLFVGFSTLGSIKNNIYRAEPTFTKIVNIIIGLISGFLGASYLFSETTGSMSSVWVASLVAMTIGSIAANILESLGTFTKDEFKHIILGLAGVRINYNYDEKTNKADNDEKDNKAKIILPESKDL